MLTWPNMTFKRPKNFCMWSKPHKIFESPPYWQGNITHALITTSHCACIPISRAECFILTYSHILNILPLEPRQYKAKNWTVLVAVENPYYIIAKPCVNQSVCLHKLIRFSMMAVITTQINF